MTVGITDDRSVPHAQGPPDETPVPQARTYLVLSEAERAQGFVRPVRTSYIHSKPGSSAGPAACTCGGDNDGHSLSCPLTPCGAVTTMGRALAETYARQPDFYGSTYCCGCSMHRPVGEFTWLDATGQTTDEEVGS
jgi:hypothetical protein